MQRASRLFWLTMSALTISACGSAVRPDGSVDGAPTDQVVVGDGVSPDVVNLPDNVIPTDSDDVVAVTDDGLVDANMDVVIPPDGFVEDIPLIDVVVPPDVVTVDAGPLCSNGITDTCPATPPGPCPNLSDGAAHTITFTGLMTGIPASCEGMTTGAGPDGIVPLTITTAQDLVLTAMPTGGDAAVIALYSAAGCGMAASELRCSNSSATMGGVARIQVASLMPGTYYVQVSSGRSSPTIVQAMLTMPRPRLMGDMCPGIAVTPDGAPATLSTAMFVVDADYGTTCGGGTAGHVDAVFSYTLTSARDVTISASATGGGGNLSMDVNTTCGDRATALPGCMAGATITRRIRNQAPGTYYFTVDYIGAPGRTIVAQVMTAAPTMAPAADRCPGVALTAGTATTVDTATLAADYALTCSAMNRADAVFSFVAPAAGNDVVFFGTSTMGGTALQVQAMCGVAGSNVPPCTSTGNGSAWQRYRGLTAGATYTGIVGTTSTAGMLSGRYTTVPAVTPMMVTTNDLCTMPTMVTEAGGQFMGNTGAFNTNAVRPGGCGGGCGAGPDAIYRLSITSAGGRRVLISTQGSTFDTVAFIRPMNTAAMPATDCNTPRAGESCNDDYYQLNSGIDVRLAVGEYWLVVAGCGGGARGAYTLDVITLP